MDAIKSMVSIMQLVGVIAVIISLAILIYRLIIYKENGDKRATFMDGFTKLLIGIIIIGSLGLIVNVVYGFLYSLMHYNGSLIANSTGGLQDSKFNSESLNTLLKGADNYSFGILGDIFAVFLSGIAKFVYNIFDLQSISQLITPAQNHVYVFTSHGWNLLAKGYTIMTVPTIALLAFMIFVTGIKFLRASINPQESAVAKEDMLRWLFTVVLIAGGFLLCKGIVIAGNVMTEILNQSVQGLMPQFDFKSFINGENMGFDGAVMSAYLVYITFKINVLFMIRDFMLGGFIVFAPLAFAMWGINKNINAFAIWLGEMLSNAFMVFFFSLSFLVFSILLYWSKSASNMNTLLFMLVGLAMILKLASVFRNSMQGWMTRMSGVNEDDISRKVSAGGMLGAVASYGKNMRNAKSGVSEMFNTAKTVAKPIRHPINSTANAVNSVKDGVGAVKDGAISALSDVNDTRKATFGKKSEGSGLKDHFNKGRNEILGSKVGSAMNEMRDNSIKNGSHFDMGQKLDENGKETGISKVGGINEKGEYESLNDNAIRYSFLKGMQSNANGEKTSSNSVLDNTRAAADNTMDSIKDAIVEDNKLQGKEVSNDKVQAQALDKFSQAMGITSVPQEGTYGEKKEALMKDSNLKGFARGNLDSIVADSRNLTTQTSQGNKGIKSNEAINKAKENYQLQNADLSDKTISEPANTESNNTISNPVNTGNSNNAVGENSIDERKKTNAEEVKGSTTSVNTGFDATTTTSSNESTTPNINSSNANINKEVGTSNKEVINNQQSSSNDNSNKTEPSVVTKSNSGISQEVGNSNEKKLKTGEIKSSTAPVDATNNRATNNHDEIIDNTSKPIIDKSLNVNENIETFSKKQKESADISENLIGKNTKNKR